MIDPCPITPSAWWHLHLYVGISVGIVAAVGVAVPWLKPDAKTPTKVIWSLAMLLLVGFEIWNIIADHSEQSEEHNHEICEEKASFDSLKLLSNDSILAMSGADSHLVIFPQHSIMEQSDGPALFKFFALSLGPHDVWDVSISMRPDGPVDETFYQTSLRSFNLKPVTATYMQSFGPTLRLDKDTTTTLGFAVTTRGDSEIENLMLRFDTKTNQWVYASWLYVAKAGGPGPPKPELLQSLPWTPVGHPVFTKGL